MSAGPTLPVAGAALSGHWCDYIDPCSGLPRHEDCSTCVYDEVSGHQCLLKYLCRADSPRTGRGAAAAAT